MQFKQLPSTEMKVFTNNHNMRSALKNLVIGRRATPRSVFFYEHESPDYLKNQVAEQLSSSSKDLNLLAEWDLRFFSKYGPQGEAAPLRERMDQFSEYFAHLDEPLIIKHPLFKKAQQITIRQLGFNQTGDPWTVDQVLADGLGQDKYNTNSAYPLYVKKKSPLALSHAKEFALTSIELGEPNTPGTRATPGKTGRNARNIFMTAMDVVVNGQRFQKPLQEFIRLKNVEFFEPWNGFDHVQAVASQFDPMTWKLSADYDHMDEHFNVHHGLAVYEVIKHYFKPKFWSELKDVIQYVFTQPIVLALNMDDNGKWPQPLYIDQDHALVSGSEWTNFLETLWNLIFWNYIELKYHVKIRHKLGIGDDQLIEFLTGKEWSEIQAMNFLRKVILKEYELAGTPGKEEKNVFSRDTFEFCQRKATVNYSGLDGKVPWALVYRLSRCLEMNVFPESFHNEKLVNKSTGKKELIYNKFTFVIQVIMRSENCYLHWKFPWWIDWIWHSNPAIREFVALKDSEILEQEKRARKISNLYTTYNQEKADKHLTEFVTFKMLRSKL